MSHAAPVDREVIPNTLSPGRGPNMTALRTARILIDQERRRQLRIGSIGRPLSLRALALIGRPCPGGWSSDGGYCNHGCRCDACREAHRVSRTARMKKDA